jgi:hypothetical protein
MMAVARPHETIITLSGILYQLQEQNRMEAAVEIQSLQGFFGKQY